MFIKNRQLCLTEFLKNRIIDAEYHKNKTCILEYNYMKNYITMFEEKLSNIEDFYTIDGFFRIISKELIKIYTKPYYIFKSEFESAIFCRNSFELPAIAQKYINNDYKNQIAEFMTKKYNVVQLKIAHEQLMQSNHRFLIILIEDKKRQRLIHTNYAAIPDGCVIILDGRRNIDIEKYHTYELFIEKIANSLLNHFIEKFK